MTVQATNSTRTLSPAMISSHREAGQLGQSKVTVGKARHAAAATSKALDKAAAFMKKAAKAVGSIFSGIASGVSNASRILYLRQIGGGQTINLSDIDGKGTAGKTTNMAAHGNESAARTLASLKPETSETESESSVDDGSTDSILIEEFTWETVTIESAQPGSAEENHNGNLGETASGTAGKTKPDVIERLKQSTGRAVQTASEKFEIITGRTLPSAKSKEVTDIAKIFDHLEKTEGRQEPTEFKSLVTER